MMTKKYNIKFDGRGFFENEIIENILNNRNIKDVDHFLNPIEEDLLPLNSMKNITEAYEILDKNIFNKNKIAVLADVDTDGVTSGTIITRYLYNFVPKENIKTFINQGKSHGLIGQDVTRFKGYNLLIIVDSLDKDVSQYKTIKEEYGCEIIILDHHAIDPNIAYDKYVCLVSSQDNYNNHALSGAGVVWKFCKYCDEQYLTDYADEFVDLAAIGILADVMDVSEGCYENRYIINKGLNNQRNLAVKKILGGYEFNSKSVLFSIAPLINACTRCGDNQDVIDMFLSDDNKELLSYKKKLESYKKLQSDEIDRLMPTVMEQIENQKDKSVVSIIVDTSYGVAGVIGNKVLDIVKRPLIIISWEDEYLLGGSMRSIGTDNFMEIINKSKFAIARGHENAAGIEIQKDKYENFLSYVRKEVDKLDLDLSEEIDIDAEITVDEATRILSKQIHDINFISGNGFKPLTFKVTGFDNYSVGSWSNGKHMVLTHSDDMLTFIEWNTSVDFDEMDEHSLMNDEIVGYGEIEPGFVGKRFLVKLILNDYEIIE